MEEVFQAPQVEAGWSYPVSTDGYRLEPQAGVGARVSSLVGPAKPLQPA